MNLTRISDAYKSLKPIYKIMIIAFVIFLAVALMATRIYQVYKQAPTSVIQSIVQEINREYGKTPGMVMSISIDDAKCIRIDIDSNKIYNTAPSSFIVNQMAMSIWKSAESSQYRADYLAIFITYYANVDDKYGNVTKEIVAHVAMERKEIAKINWDRFSTKSVPGIATSYTLFYDI